MKLKERLVCASLIALILSAFYFGWIAFAAWKSPEELHPPICEEWNSEAKKIKDQLWDWEKDEVKAIVADDTLSPLEKRMEIDKIKLGIGSIDIPRKKGLFEAIKFSWNYAKRTSPEGGVWKILIFFIFGFFLSKVG